MGRKPGELDLNALEEGFLIGSLVDLHEHGVIF
jgi:hypothetical protein